MLTTVYLGATDRRALDWLVAHGAEVRVSYDTRRTRLHAKAWLFHRPGLSGSPPASTAYIGSSNLSTAALHDGLEWNVRLSAHDNEGILAKFQAAFESYWEEGEFEPYRASELEQRRFDRAVREESAGDCGEQTPPRSASSTSAPTPTSRRSSKSCRPSAASMAAGATWWWPPPARAKP